jgi:hypothetical protein
MMCVYSWVTTGDHHSGLHGERHWRAHLLSELLQRDREYMWVNLCKLWRVLSLIRFYIRFILLFPGILPLVADGPVIPEVPNIPIPVGALLESLSYGEALKCSLAIDA